jgi:tetratricopeptide (TPR) repeat protein
MRGMTQEQLAGKDFTKGFISLLERDGTQPSVGSLVLLAKRLETSVDSLLGVAENPSEQATTSLLALSASALRKRNAKQAEELLSAVEVLARLFPSEEATRELQLQKGQLALERREFPKTLDLLTVAKTMAEEAGDNWRVGRALVTLATAHLRERDFRSAVTLGEQALLILRKARAGRDPVRIEALLTLGTALRFLGDHDGAVRRFQEAATSHIAKHNLVFRARALWGLGFTYRRINRLDQAKSYLLQARDLFERTEELPDLVRVLHNLAQVAYEQRSYPEALRVFRHALRVAERLDMKVLRTSTLTEISRVYVAREDWTNAEATAMQAVRLAEEIGDPVEVAEAQLILARVAASRGRDEQALRLVQKAHVAFRERGMADKVAEAASAIGMVLLAKRRKAAAADFLAMATRLEVARTTDRPI